jgi:LysM repeat protein
MSSNVSSNYSSLFGNRVPAQTAPATATSPGANLPVQAPDSMNISALPNGVQPATTVTATADQRDQLIQLRKQLMDVDREIEQMIVQMNSGQPAVATVPTPVAPAATVPTAATIADAGGTVKIQPGDYLWKIAKQKLGDANRWPEIYTLNKDVIGDNPNLLQPGQVLTLPGGRTTSAVPTPVQRTQPAFSPATPLIQPAPITNQPSAGIMDVAAVPTGRQIADQQALSVAREFGLLPANGQLTPDAKANVAAFMDEIDSYEKTYRGQVFGPGMDNTDPRLGPVLTPIEAQKTHQSIAELQKAFSMLILAGKLHPTLANGQAVQTLAETGTYFKVDASGATLRDAQGNPLMDEALVAAVTQFKLDHGIHQSYRLGDGTFGINEYIGPETVAALKRELLIVKAGQR